MEFLEKLQAVFGDDRCGNSSSRNGFTESDLSSDALRWIVDMSDTEQYRITQVALAVCGIIGNILSIMGWSGNKTWSAAVLFLVSLAVFDIVFLTGTTLEVILRMINIQTMANVRTYKGFYVSASCISDFGIQGSSLMTVAIATERLVAATKPQRVALICYLFRAKVVVVVTIVLCVLRFIIRLLYEIPVVMRDIAKSVDLSNTNTVVLSAEMGSTNDTVGAVSSTQTTSIISNEEWTYIRLVLDIALVYTIPWILLFVFNVVTIVALKKGKWKESVKQVFKFKPRKNLCSKIRFQKRLFYAVLILTSVSIITYPVAVVTRLVTSDARKVFSPLVNILVLVKIVNSGVNFVIYYCINTNFRRRILNIIFCMRDDFNDWRRNCIYY